MTNQANNQLVIPYISGDITPNGKLLINFQVIQRWANNFAIGGGFYASLTGDGETMTPGSLVQLGQFSVRSDDVTFVITETATTLATETLEIDASDGTSFATMIMDHTGTFFTCDVPFNVLDHFLVSMAQTGTVDQFLVGTVGGIKIIEAHVNNLLQTLLGFFGATPVIQQPTPSTLADVIALLQAYGLCP